LLYGITFPLVHDALQDVEPFAYLALRFGLASLVLAPIAIGALRRSVDLRALWRVGLALGVVLAGAYATQTVGLETTSPSTSAFITGLYVACTPFLEGAVRRVVPGARIWAGTAIATFGLFLLTGADLAGIGAGELWTLACAVLFAAWIVGQGQVAGRFDPIALVSVQTLVVVFVCAPAAAVQGVGDLTTLAWVAVVFTGIACSAVALPLQLWAQRRISPSRTALIFMLEPVFAAVAGYVNGERLGSTELLGALVILVGIGVVELGGGVDRRAPVPPHSLP
jgi:drug/metabolite transporter (DMT)-like permease